MLPARDQRYAPSVFTTSCTLSFLPRSKANVDLLTGLSLEDMDELFRDCPVFIPGSKWQPSSHLDEDAREIAKREREAGVLGKDQATEYLEEA